MQSCFSIVTHSYLSVNGCESMFRFVRWCKHSHLLCKSHQRVSSRRLKSSSNLLYFFLSICLLRRILLSRMTTGAGNLFTYLKYVVPHWTAFPSKNKKYIYRVSHELRSLLRESVPYVKIYRYNPQPLCQKLNGYGDNGHRKVWASGGPRTVRSPWRHTRPLRMHGSETSSCSDLGECFTAR
jgi:hypothetical protein